LNRPIAQDRIVSIVGRVDEATRRPGGTLCVRGWAAGPRPVCRIVVRVAGAVVGDASLGRPRPDVAADPNLSGAGGDTGFELVVIDDRVRTLGAGDPVVAEVVLADGRRGQLPPVEVAATVVGHIDDVRWEPLPSRPMVVQGWAYAVGDVVSAVEVAVGGVVLGRAGLGRLRSDVAAALDEADAELAGFELAVDTAAIHLPDGPQEIEVVARTFSGVETVLEPSHTDVPPAAAPPCRVPTLPARPRGPARPRRRVLWFARHLDAGGSQLRMLDLIVRLGRSHGITSVVVAPGDGGLGARLIDAGAEVHLAGPVVLDDIGAYERQVGELTAWATGRFDAVVAFTLTSFVGIDVAHEIGVPSIWRIGEAKPLHEVARWFGQALDPRVEARARAAAEQASAVVHVSEAGERAFAGAGYAGRSHVLRTGVDLTAIDAYRGAHDRAATRRRLGLGDELTFVNAGSLWPVKGQAPFLVAFERFARRAPVRCVLVGEGLPDYRDAVSSFVRRRGIEHAVDVRPFTDDIDAWWLAADVALCSSESEAMPAAVLEAMAFGLPVLASDAGGLAESVREGVNGWSFDPSDLRSVRAATARAIAASPEERRRLGAAGRAHVLVHHDAAAQADRFARLLAEVSSPA
jgi:glycosyltransferase involved in cell wall biosynthesis